MATNPDGSSTYFPLPGPQGQAVYNQCLSVVKQAQVAWATMVSEFAAENLAMGITQAQAAMIGAALNQVMIYGSEGSLWLAYAALSNVVVTPEMAPFLTEDRLAWAKNKMIQVIAQL
jgi:hypothetical protein